jgi:hypothetical protein
MNASTRSTRLTLPLLVVISGLFFAPSYQCGFEPMRSPAQWVAQQPLEGLFWGAPPYWGAVCLAALIGFAWLRRTCPRRGTWVAATVALVSQAAAQLVPWAILLTERHAVETWGVAAFSAVGLAAAGMVVAWLFWRHSGTRAGWAMFDVLAAAYGSLALTSMAMFVLLSNAVSHPEVLGPGAPAFGAAVVAVFASGVIAFVRSFPLHPGRDVDDRQGA